MGHDHSRMIQITNFLATNRNKMFKRTSVLTSENVTEGLTFEFDTFDLVGW